MIAMIILHLRSTTLANGLIWELYHTTKIVYGSDLASLTDTVASHYTKQKVKHGVRKSIPNIEMPLWH